VDETLIIEISDNYFIYAKDVYLTWLLPGSINLIINDRYIAFDIDRGCFVLEGNPMHSINISNHMRPCCVSAGSCRSGWANCEDMGRFQSIAFADNIILAQHRNNKPQGKILGRIENTGIYSPEAKSFDDEKHRFNCIRFGTGGRVSKIWKVS